MPDGGRDGGGLIGGADHQAGVEDVGQQLREVIAAVASDIGTNFSPFTIQLVTLCTDLFERLFTSDFVAG